MARDIVPLADYYSLESPIATELRRLLHNLQKNAAEGELKSILLTSATTGEGKSTLSSLLAITAAKKGLKTLLIDCDMRRPTLHKLFTVERRHGLTEVLGEGVAGKSVIKKTTLDTLDIITAGASTPNPTELFDARQIGALIAEQKFYYDYVFIDSPPVIPVSDPMLLAQEVDGTLLVIKAGATAREVVARAAEIMSSGGTNLLGAVLNNVNGSLPYYYDYTHYNYDYSPKPEKGSQRKSKSNPNLKPAGSRPMNQSAGDRTDATDKKKIHR